MVTTTLSIEVEVVLVVLSVMYAMYVVVMVVDVTVLSVSTRVETVDVENIASKAFNFDVSIHLQ